MIGVKGAGNINIILALPEDLLGGLRVWDNWLQLGRTSLCRTFSSVRLAKAIVRAEPHVSLTDKDFYLEESSKVSRLLYLTKRGGAFLQK